MSLDVAVDNAVGDFRLDVAFTSEGRITALFGRSGSGKTTLVDKMILASQIFKEHEVTGDLMLDNNDLERERDECLIGILQFMQRYRSAQQ